MNAVVDSRCRGLLSDIPASANLQLDDTAASVLQLISGMYDANSQVDWSNVTPLLELARKYDVEDISDSCGRFLDAETMSVSNLPRLIRLACEFGMHLLVQRCQQFIAGGADNFTAISR